MPLPHCVVPGTPLLNNLVERQVYMSKDEWISAIQDIIKNMDAYEEELRTSPTIPSVHHILLAIDRLQTSTQDTHIIQILSEARYNVKIPEPGPLMYTSTAKHFYAASSLLETLANYIQEREDLFQ